MPIIFVYFFTGLALIVVLASCFNYTNLSIARSLSRAREIGVRKVSGASRIQIFYQFMVESVALALIALVVAVALLILIKPFLLNLQFARVLHWDMEANITVYALFLIFTIFIGLLAGSFPAVVLSGFQPVTVLKKIGSLKIFSHLNLRKALLVFQFSLSLIFIISVTLLSNQLDLFLNKDHGFDMSNKLVVRLNNSSPQTLQNELRSQPGILSTSAASHLPAIGVTYGEVLKKDAGNSEGISFDYFNVDENYLENLSLELVAGRFFSESDQSRKFVVINEEAVKKLSFKTPVSAVGEPLHNLRDSSNYEIIGVVKDYNQEAMISKIQPLALHFPTDGFNIVQVAYAGDRNAAVKSLQTAWSMVNPNQKIDFTDMEGEVKGFYKMVFADFVSIIGILCGIAIIISCLGLLGIAAYTIETKMKEIAIRKILGSSIKALLYNLSKGFLFVILVAIVIATPVAWFINQLWLDELAYKTEFGIEVFSYSISFLLLLALLTIGSQSLKAAFSNPINSIKNE